MILLQNIKKTYKDRVIFDVPRLELLENHTYVLLGSNGVGKTTLLKGLANILKLDKKIYRNPAVTYYYLGEENNLLAYLSGRDNILLILKLKKIEVNKRELDELLSNLKLTDYIDELVIKYSKGMLEKLKITIAYLVHADILLLDEPFTSLDLENTQAMKRLIKDYAKEHVVLLTTHLVEVAYTMADKLLFLKDKDIICKDNGYTSSKELENFIINSIYTQ